jgi:hypothetical protein
VQGGDYPHSLKADISQLSWQLRGAELPPDGMNGQGSLQANWQEDEKTLRFDNLNLTANGSTDCRQRQRDFRRSGRTGRWIFTPPLLTSTVCWRTVAGDGLAPASRARVRRDRCAR